MTQLYDYAGRPVKTAELKRPQTAETAWLHREFSNHPSRGLTPLKLARLLEEAEQGDLTAQAQLAEDMEEKDAHLFAELNKRKRAVLSESWTLEPPENPTAAEKAGTETVKAILDGLDIDDLLLDMASAILAGYAAIELEWHRPDGFWEPKEMNFRPADWFMCRQEERNILRLRSVAVNGEDLRPLGWIIHRHQAKSGYIARTGLVRVLCWPFLFRNFAARDMAEFLEIYGLPLRLGTYPPGAGDKEKATLMRAVVGIGHAAAGIIPEGMRIDFQEATKGAADPFSAMLDWAEKSESKAICGGTLTSQTDDGGAYALGEVHENAFKDIVKSDLRQYAKTLNSQLIWPICQLNTAMTRPARIVFDLEEPEDFKLYADAIPKLVTAGVQIPEPWVRRKLHIPEAAEGEAVLGAQKETAAMRVLLRNTARLRKEAAVLKRMFKQTDQLRTEAEPEGDEQDAQVRTLETAVRKPMDGMIAALRKMVDEADSLEGLLKTLETAWPDLDASEFADVMAEAMTAANMAGRYEILEGL